MHPFFVSLVFGGLGLYLSVCCVLYIKADAVSMASVWSCTGRRGRRAVLVYMDPITMPVPHYLVFTGRMPFLPPNQQCQSTEGIMTHTE